MWLSLCVLCVSLYHPSLSSVSHPSISHRSIDSFGNNSAARIVLLSLVSACGLAHQCRSRHVARARNTPSADVRSAAWAYVEESLKYIQCVARNMYTEK